jgi:hypothetical protein
MTRRPIPALSAALGVTGFLIASDLLRVLTSLLAYNGFDILPMLGYGLLAGLGQNLVIGLGVFLVFWLVTPITAAMPLARTIGVGTLAALGGAILAAILQVLGALAFAREASGSLYDLIPLGVQPLPLFTEALLRIVALLPLTVLAAILLREWLRSKVATSPASEAAVEPAEAV